MSYQVLARKWRPRFFREMVGQEHVLQALINALDHNRLHHAYLFTGTRGVGKTTIARILAKCLNCETGVSSEPCGTCSSCQEINDGCFIDLIEVDAASNTGVDDVRQIIDNAQYRPTKGRYKVYLIDEVHMLSKNAFNALLKTLEEPPEHVKFLLATTDPQKLPATILSRCLQFYLKNMAPERIVGHLSNVLQQEMVEFEEPALWALARSAEGSMRDALSLTDQAIAFGSGKVFEAEVRVMLGSIDQQTVYHLAEALLAHDAQKLLTAIEEFSEQAPDYPGVLDELLLLLHRMTIAQMVPAAIDNSLGDQDRVLALAQSVTTEELQLFYQMGVMGKRDLSLAPDLRTGLEMTVLRMLAFRPEGLAEPPSKVLPTTSAVPVAQQPPIQQSEAQQSVTQQSITQQSMSQTAVAPEQSAPQQEAEESLKKPEQVVEAAAAKPVVSVVTDPVAAVPVVSSQPEIEQEPEPEPEQKTGLEKEPSIEQKPEPELEPEVGEAASVEVQFTLENNSIQSAPVERAQVEQNDTELFSEEVATLAAKIESKVDLVVEVLPETPLVEVIEEKNEAPTTLDIHLFKENAQWVEHFQNLPFSGLLKAVASACVLMSVEGSRWQFSLDKERAQLYNEQHNQQIADVLSDYFSETIEVIIQRQTSDLQTPADYLKEKKQIAYDAALNELQNDSGLQGLIEQYSAVIDMNSVEAIESGERE